MGVSFHFQTQNTDKTMEFIFILFLFVFELAGKAQLYMPESDKI